MDPRLVSPFVSAVRNVFQTLASTEVRVGKPYVKTGGPCSADVSGVIGLSGDATGCAVLSFPKAVAAPRGTAS